MPLTAAQASKILDWIRVHTRDQPCSECGEKQFRLHPSAVTLPLHADIGSGKASADFNEQVPLVVVTCHSCGHVRFFSPVVMGVNLVGPARVGFVRNE